MTSTTAPVLHLGAEFERAFAPLRALGERISESSAALARAVRDCPREKSRRARAALRALVEAYAPRAALRLIEEPSVTRHRSRFEHSTPPAEVPAVTSTGPNSPPLAREPQEKRAPVIT